METGIAALFMIATMLKLIGYKVGSHVEHKIFRMAAFFLLCTHCFKFLPHSTFAETIFLFLIVN